MSSAGFSSVFSSPSFLRFLFGRLDRPGWARRPRLAAGGAAASSWAANRRSVLLAFAYDACWTPAGWRRSVGGGRLSVGAADTQDGTNAAGNGQRYDPHDIVLRD